MFWYVISNNKVVAKCLYLPDETDLKSRGEMAIKTDLDIDLSEARFLDGKIQKHVKSEDELKVEEKSRENTKLIQERMKEIAVKELKQEGKL